METGGEGASRDRSQEVPQSSLGTGNVAQTAVVAVESDLDRKEAYLQAEPVGLDSMWSKRRRGQNGH